MIREGSIRRDLKTIIPFVISHGTYTNRLMFCSDGLDPNDITNYGHIDHCVKESIELGLDPIDAISMASKNCFDYYKMNNDFGGIAPGKIADILVFDNLKKIKIKKIFLGGKLIVSNGKILPTIKKPKLPSWLINTVKTPSITENDFIIKSRRNEENVNVISMKTEIVTAKTNEILKTNLGNVTTSTEKDIWKVAAFDRTFGSKKHSLGFLKNFGADIGAFASTWSFHENDMIIIGANEKDMSFAANKLRKSQGGMIVVKDRKVLAFLPMEVAGIISSKPIDVVANQFSEINNVLVDHGCIFKKPHLVPVFLPFLALPDIRILYSGIVDIKKREFIPTIIS